MSSQIHVQWCHVDSLNSVTVGVFTPWQLANTTNQGFFFPPSEQVVEHFLAWPLLYQPIHSFASCTGTLPPPWWWIFSHVLDPPIADSWQQCFPCDSYLVPISSWNLRTHSWLSFCLLAPKLAHLKTLFTAGQADFPASILMEDESLMLGPSPSLPAQCCPKDTAASYPGSEQARMRQML